MPPVLPPTKALVTGANGFIGAWTAKAFLDAGFSVRAAVRDESKTIHLKKVFAEHGDKLEFALVPDMTKVRHSRPALRCCDSTITDCSPLISATGRTL